MPCIICDYIESLIKKIDRCSNNLEILQQQKSVSIFLAEYSVSTIWAFDRIENKHTLYRRKDFMKKF